MKARSQNSPSGEGKNVKMKFVEKVTISEYVVKYHSPPLPFIPYLAILFWDPKLLKRSLEFLRIYKHLFEKNKYIFLLLRVSEANAPSLRSLVVHMHPSTGCPVDIQSTLKPLKL